MSNNNQFSMMINKAINCLVAMAMIVYSVVMIFYAVSDRGAVVGNMFGSELRTSIYYAIWSIFTSGVLHAVLVIKNAVNNNHWLISVFVVFIFVVSIFFSFVFIYPIQLLIVVNAFLFGRVTSFLVEWHGVK